MTVSDATTWFAQLAHPDRNRFLARLAHELTIAARETYDAGTDGVVDPAALRLINEIQHRVTSHLLALLTNDTERYPDDVLIQMILADAEASAGGRMAKQAFAAAQRRMTTSSARQASLH